MELDTGRRRSGRGRLINRGAKRAVTVIWKFAPEAAERAAGFRFHPDQVLEPQDDGSLIVRFHAAGWLEMAWHLYQWGDKVEVLAPEGLRDYVHPWRRSDLDGMP